MVALKYLKGAKLLIASIFISIVVLISAIWNVASASSGLMTYKCGGWTAVIEQREEGPLVASFLPEVGTWIEIPVNDRSGNDMNLYFMSIETQKLAVMGVNAKNQIFLQTFRNHQAYKLNKLEHSLLCKRTHG